MFPEYFWQKCFSTSDWLSVRVIFFEFKKLVGSFILDTDVYSIAPYNLRWYVRSIHFDLFLPSENEGNYAEYPSFLILSLHTLHK